MRKLILLVISVLTLSLGLLGCGNAEESSTPGKKSESKEPVSIRMQIAWPSDSDRGLAVREVLNQFEAKNPNIKVELVGSAQGDQKLLTQILSGKAPEVIQVAYRDLLGLAPQQGFNDLTKELSGLKDNYYEQSWDQALYEKKVYGLPWLGHTIQLVYNKDLFEKAGIKEAPKTWAELYEAAKKLTVDTNGDGKIDQYGIGLVGKQTYDITWMVNMFMTQAGAELVKQDGNEYKIAVNSPEAKEALEFYKKLVTETSPPDTTNKDGGGVMADFRNQVVAMEFQGPWGVTDIWKSGNTFKVGAAAMTEGPAGKGADVSTYMLSIPTGVEGAKFDASIELIKYLGSKEAQEMIMKGEKINGEYYPFRIPIRKDLADMQYLKDHPEFNIFIEGLKYPSISTPIPAWTQIETEVYTSILNQVVSGQLSIEEGLKTIEERGNDIIKQSK
ncbi:ABC-type glycerol-3-phosphate transport system substrate-binding protein [Bacillus niacini]|uniref:ABC-type glycerol-3-phosphate transport system substrate-binding protein n=1 Tax=Neobacillus niacini TaxID=86668 RepID=A0A852TEU4_9BACI|nr:sugar ABC transporter substrate-binding protein [Neobacillus niacini]NYE05868.1 ABC-type glycerol-3-phosphate transport system substrate-binding protein [Neobacillus niacini]